LLRSCVVVVVVVVAAAAAVVVAVGLMSKRDTGVLIVVYDPLSW